MMNEEFGPSPGETRLDSWKAIAAHLKRDERTVRRWEKSEGLPVRRELHQARSSVYAYVSEIDAWARMRQPRRDETPRWRRSVPKLAFAAVLMLSLLLVADAPFSATAAAQQQPSMSSRRVWTPPANWDFITGATMSSDGRLLSFVDWATGDLAVHDFVTDSDRRLTNKSWNDNSEFAEESAVSRDGRRIAYSWYKPETDRFELRVASLEGSGLLKPELLFDSENVGWLMPSDWSPDGNWDRRAVGTQGPDTTNGPGFGSGRLIANSQVRGLARSQRAILLSGR
jgi:hypothetical protein